jgi:hypothetical protein
MQLLQDNQLFILLALAALVLVQFVFVLGLKSQVGRQSRLIRTVLSGPGGEDLETLLKRCREESRQAIEQSATLETKLENVAATLRGCVQHIGLVRYDAFSDVSGAQSFSAALLDNEQNGIVLTGLLGRNDGRCYGKTVVAGRAEQTLSEEEESALQMAMSGGIGGAGSSTPLPTRNSKRERAARG